MTILQLFSGLAVGLGCLFAALLVGAILTSRGAHNVLSRIFGKKDS